MRPLATAALAGILAGALLAPAGHAQFLFDRDLGTDLGLANDSVAEGLALGFVFPFAGAAYTHVSVCSNGYLWLGPVALATPDHTPSLAELRAEGPRIAPLWAHYDPAAPGGGHVWFKAAPGRAVITWAHVFEHGTTNAVEFQVSLFASGHVDVAYGPGGPIGSAKNGEFLIGAASGRGGAVALVDFAQLPFLTGTDDFAELRPTVGALKIARSKLNWSPAFPGFAVSAVACAINRMPPPAAFAPVGTGCPLDTVTGYEVFDDAVGGNPLDLFGTTLMFRPNGAGGYAVARSDGTPGPQPYAWVTDLGAGDDTVHAVTLPWTWPHATGPIGQVFVGADGFVTLGRAPIAGEPPGATTLLAGPPRIAAFWTDMDAAQRGSVRVMFEPRKGEFAVEWSDLPVTATKMANTFALVLEPDGGFRIELRSAMAMNPVAVVGYSDGDGALDPDAVDFHTAPFDLGARREPLRLAVPPGAAPRLGETFGLQVTGIAPSPDGHLVFLLLGAEMPPLDLQAFGAPGCAAWLPLPADMVLVNVAFGMPTSTFTVPVPNAIDLAGLALMSQAVSDDMHANALGWRMSNGGRWLVGL
ncbi:MAG: hypothetical protein AB7O97_02830 [Planctomycetota bacterium]